MIHVIYRKVILNAKFFRSANGVMKSTESSEIPRRGYFYVILAAVLWASSGSLSKFLFNKGMSPFELVQLRITIAALILFLWLLIRRPSLLRIYPKDIFYFIMLGTAGMAAVQFTYLFAISKIKVAAAILLQYLAPSFIALYSVLIARERLSRLAMLSMIGATIGCYFVVGAYNLDILAMNYAGIISGIFSAIAFAGYSIYSEYGMRRYHPWTVLFFGILIAAGVWNILQPPLKAFAHAYSPIEWACILYIVILGTILPFGLYYEAINLIRATRASITATLEPITAGVLSYLFLKEAMEPLQIAGGAMVIASVILLQLKQEQDNKTPVIIRGLRREGP
jgi:drug/metabolite transporter (DMT)-like permease